MRTSPYNIDLRKEVIKYIELGNSQRSASKLFMLSPSTVNRWCVRYKREGNFAARKRLGRAPRINALLVQEYIKDHPNFTSAEMGGLFWRDIRRCFLLARVNHKICVSIKF